MIKIAQFLNNTGNHIGGVEQCAINYSKAFSSRNNYKIYTTLPHKNICYSNHILGELLKVNIKNKITLFLSIIRIIIQIKPKFIILHCSRGLKLFYILSKIYKFKIIGVSHGFNLDKFSKYTDFIFCINKTQIAELKNKVNDKKIIYFPNVTNIPNIKGRKEMGKKIIIGTLSRIDFKYKNLDKIVLAAKIMKDEKMNFVFHIGGDYGEIDRLKQMVIDYELNNYFIFKGFVKDKIKFFSEIDIFCMPSKEETFGISYIEAMAHKVPCIATNTEGALEIFSKKDSAIIIDKNQENHIPNEIYKAIILITENTKLKDNLIEKSFDIVKNNFSFNSLLNRFKNIINDS